MLAIAAAGPTPVAPAQAPPLRGLAEYVQGAVREWEVPGLAIAVVKDDSVVFAQGFGVREVGKGAAVDPNTVFSIGSATKAFTAATVGMLVDEEKLEWDDPVVRHLPSFRFPGPHADEVTLRDLLAHRTGLAQANLALMTPYSREQIVKRIGHLEPASPLRSRFTYHNQAYLVAGMAAAAAAGQNWDVLVRERIFEPLGMSASSTSIRAIEGKGNLATPHARIGGRMRPIPRFDLDNTAPAGALNSSALDMAQWVRLQLGGGEYNGKRILSPAVLRQMQAPQTVIPIGPVTAERWPSTHFLAYGLGWFLRDYRGHKIVEHGGNVAGMTAQVALVPEEWLGVVILSNADGTALPTALMYRVIDAYLGPPVRDWSAELLAATHDAEQARAGQAQADAPDPSATPRLPLARYAGSYEHPVYGTAAVSLRGRGLVLQLTPGVVGDLVPLGADSFTVRWHGPYLAEYGMRGPVRFGAATDGAPQTLHFENLAEYARVGKLPAGEGQTRSAATH